LIASPQHVEMPVVKNVIGTDWFFNMNQKTERIGNTVYTVLEHGETVSPQEASEWWAKVKASQTNGTNTVKVK